MSRYQDIFGDGAAADESRRRAEAGRRARAWIAAADRLCASEDFRTFLYDVLDDLALFDREETPLGEFAQGFRAAAHRIRNRMMEADAAPALFAGFARRHHDELHARLTGERARANGETETEGADHG